MNKLTLPPRPPRPPQNNFNRSAPQQGGRDQPQERERRDDGPRVGRFIRAPQVRLIGPDGEMLGVVATRDAMVKAQEFGLDLVEISPNAEPPVAKILDYGKYKYEEQKKKKEARKKQKTIEVKEIKLRPTIDDHDLMVKVRQMREFLTEGDKVKLSMRFRGREAAYRDIGMNIIAKVREELKDVGKAEAEPKMEGNQVFLMLVAAS